MERRVRYEVLHNQDEDDDMPQTGPSEPAVPVMLNIHSPPNQAEFDPPPPEDSYWATQGRPKQQEPPVPPSYNVATSLPSYEEAERTKQEEIEQQELENQQQQSHPECGLREVDRFTDMQLGTDGMFLCMFMIAFLFNWIGLLASLCITHTVAGRFGAIAGFGLSMVKWVAIVKLSFQHNNWAGGIAEGDSWLWWLLIILGFLIFFRGCTQYVRLKYQWHRLGTHMRSRVYLLF